MTYDPFGRITTMPADLVSGSGNETIGYYSNDLINTLTQGSTTETWALDPANRYLTSTQTGAATATTNHYSDSSDSPSWSSITNSMGVTSTTVNDPDLTGSLAATTSDNSSATSVTYQLTDQQGNVIATTPPSEGQVSAVSNDPYGTDLWGTNRYEWLGGDQRDGSSLGGIVLMGARGYAPEIGRFLSVDPVLGGNDNPYVYPSDPIVNSDTNGAQASFSSPFPTVVLRYLDCSARYGPHSGWHYTKTLATNLHYAKGQSGLLHVRLTFLTRDEVPREGCRYAEEVPTGVQA
jgi:RHS repeat-associated protein